MSEIIVKKVNLQEDKIDRLENTIELKNDTIKFQQDQYLKLLCKVNDKEPLGLNYLLFTYEELVTIILDKHNPLYEYISRWFYLDEDCKYENSLFEDENYNYELYFSEDAIEVEQDGYWLVNVKEDLATTFKDISKLNRKMYQLKKEESWLN